MVERTAGLMRRRTAGGDECFVVAKDERWLRLSAVVVVQDRFLADGFEAGYVWDPHLASDTVVLEIRVQPATELVVLARVADEAGVELDRLIEERGKIIDQPVWEAHTAKERMG